MVSGGRAARTIGVAARAAKGAVGQPVTLTSWAAGASVFGEDGTPGMSTILRLLFENGASTVTAVRVAEGGTAEDYAQAFAALGRGGAPGLVPALIHISRPPRQGGNSYAVFRFGKKKKTKCSSRGL